MQRLVWFNFDEVVLRKGLFRSHVYYYQKYYQLIQTKKVHSRDFYFLFNSVNKAENLKISIDKWKQVLGKISETKQQE